MKFIYGWWLFMITITRFCVWCIIMLFLIMGITSWFGKSILLKNIFVAFKTK